MRSEDEVIDSEDLLIGEIPIYLNYSIISLTFPTIFKYKKTEEDLVKVEGKHPNIEEYVGQDGVAIESSEECRP